MTHRRITLLASVGAVTIVFASACSGAKNGAHRAANTTTTANTPAATTSPAPTTTTTSVATTTSATTTTTSMPTVTVRPASAPPTTAAGADAPATAADLRASVSIDHPTLRAEVLSSFTLDVTNIADHAVSFPDGVWIGVSIESTARNDWSWGVVPRPVATLEPGEQRTLRGDLRTGRGQLGAVRITPTVIEDGGVFCRCAPVPHDLPGAASIPATVIPPGWSPGQPLDPSQGTWRVVMSADAHQVAAGDTLTLRAKVTNTGTEAQRTQAYTALSVACEGPNQSMFTTPLDHAILDPGATKTFTTEYRPSRFDVGRVSCSAGIQTRSLGPDRQPRASLHNTSVTIAVILATSASTTTTTT